MPKCDRLKNLTILFEINSEQNKAILDKVIFDTFLIR